MRGIRTPGHPRTRYRGAAPLAGPRHRCTATCRGGCVPRDAAAVAPGCAGGRPRDEAECRAVDPGASAPGATVSCPSGSVAGRRVMVMAPGQVEDERPADGGGEFGPLHLGEAGEHEVDGGGDQAVGRFRQGERERAVRGEHVVAVPRAQSHSRRRDVACPGRSPWSPCRARRPRAFPARMAEAGSFRSSPRFHTIDAPRAARSYGRRACRWCRLPSGIGGFRRPGRSRRSWRS